MVYIKDGVNSKIIKRYRVVGKESFWGGRG